MSLSKKSAKEANTLPGGGHNIEDSNAINEPDSISNTDSDDTEEFEEIIGFQEVNENENPTFVTRMLNLCRELVIFCLIMITLEALTKNPPKVSKPPAAYPFFSKDSIVTDWYQGQISKAIEQAKSSDIAFVMFYAPWDAESQAARKEFEAAAKYFQDYVSFTAVNCWQPESECKNQYSKVYKWPVLIAYPAHGRGVQYTGPISSIHLIKFLQKVCHPFMRFNEHNLKKTENAYAVVTLNTSPGSRHFAVFYTATLKYLEKDPLHTVTFFVNPQLVSKPLLQLHLWNETLIYPLVDNDWISDDILQWIFKNYHQVMSWVAPSRTKSLVLSSNLQPGPGLILFTPKNPLRNTDYFFMLQEIGYEYHNCDENMLANLHGVSLKLKRSHNLIKHKILKEKCAVKQDISNRQVLSHLNPKRWANTSSCSQRPIPQDCDILDQENNRCSNLESEECSKSTKICENDQSFEHNFVQSYKTSMLTGENDWHSAENLLKLLNVDKCRQFRAAEKYHHAIFENQISKKDVSITGLACKSNASITFIAMDSLLYYHFAERLGINLWENKDKSALVILSEEMESQFIMKAPINGVNVREFIRNFTEKQLPRSLDSYSLVRENRSQTSVPKDGQYISIEELNTVTFLPTVLQENKAVVVFYYSKQCAFCSGISFVLLTAARKLSSVENLSFFRIDGDINNLPWEYTMERFPTILFFPADDKSETRVFPHEYLITIPNLMGFILANLDPSMKLEAMWTMCNQTKLEAQKKTCMSSVQAETLSVIDVALRDWRRSNKRQKQIILHKLKQLKQLHLLISHFPQKHVLIQNYFKKLNSNLCRSKDYHSEKTERLRNEF